WNLCVRNLTGSRSTARVAAITKTFLCATTASTAWGAALRHRRAVPTSTLSRDERLVQSGHC
ncbi:unnamed protein product, partial [Amoebophrya sp. A25]